MGTHDNFHPDVAVFQVGHRVPNGSYTFWFVVGRNIQSLELFISNEQGQHVLPSLAPQTCNLNLDPDCTLCPASSTHAISIDFASLPEGKYDVRFIGHFPKIIR
jgi:hypothetical protein